MTGPSDGRAVRVPARNEQDLLAAYEAELHPRVRLRLCRS